jgi:TonB family protein
VSGRETPTPKRIGRYEIVGNLGAGSMGAVYKGFDPLIKRTLAIKTIRLDLPRDSIEYRTFLERFYQEARISGTLSHPGIVTLYDIGEEAGVPFLAMEFIDGETLESLLGRGGKIPAARAVAFVAQIAGALDYAHSRDIVHRDVKPANLLVFDEGRVKITDFGIAKLANTSLTKVGQLLGTPAYMSPEQASGEALDGRSDIFSLGTCAFELLAGVQPFVGAAVTDVLFRIVNDPPQRPGDLAIRGLVPKRWEAVFGRVLAKRREDRYQTAAEFARELELCLAEPGVGTGTRPPGFVPAPAPPPVRTIPPRVRKDATTPPGGLPAVEGDAPTILIGAWEAAGPDAVTERIAAGEAVPETIALTPEQVSAMREVGERSPDESPGSEEPTILMPSSELPLLPTQKIGPAEARQLLDAGDLPTDRYAAIGDTVSLGEPPPTVPDRPIGPAAVPGKPKAVVWGGVAAAVVIAALVSWLWLSGSGEAGGAVAVTTDPPGATISVDGELRGPAPLTLDDLGPGTHEIRATLEGHLDAVRSVEVSAGGAPRDLLLELRSVAPTSGLLSVASEPQGARVVVDGRDVGETPQALELEPGEHSVSIEKAGHRPWSGQLTVEAGVTTELSRTLEVVRRAAPTPAPATTLAAAPTPEPEPEVAAATPTPAPTPTPLDTNRVFFAEEVDEAPERTSGAFEGLPSLKRGETVSIQVSWVIDQDGRVDDITVMESGGAEWDREIVKSLRGWRYRPGKRQGVAVKVRLMRKFTFKDAR